MENLLCHKEPFVKPKGASDVKGFLWNHLDKKFILWHHEAPLFLRAHVGFLRFIGTFHRCNGFYTVQTVYPIALHLDLRLIGNRASPSWELELHPLGVATGNALSVTRSEDTYVKTPPVGRRQPMTSLPACHNISAAGRIHHQLFRLHWLVCLKRAEWIW